MSSTPDPNKIDPIDEAGLAGDAPDNLLRGHRYDGIREYDNPMPGWWVWLFWITIGFAVVYTLGVHVFDFIDTYQEDLAEQIESMDAQKASYAAANPSFVADEATLAAVVDDAAAAEQGASYYASYCAACHGDQGQGLIGPNLTDAYWIHGGSNTDLFEILRVGVADKGMPAWESALSGEQRAQLVAFIRSLEGTNPPDAKQPEGEPYEPAA